MIVLADFDFEGADLSAFSGLSATPPTLSTDHAAHGLKSMKCDSRVSSQIAHMDAQHLGEAARVAVWLDVPVAAGDSFLISVTTPPQNSAVEFGWNAVQAKYFVRYYNATFTEQARAYSTSGLGIGKFIRFEWSIDTSVTPWVVKWGVADGDGALHNEADFNPALAANATIENTWLGYGGGSGPLAYYDDFKLTQDAADFPLGKVVTVASPTNDVSQHATAAEVAAWLTGPPLRYSSAVIAKLVARFKTNAQDPIR